jgi:hypothetical protein
MEIIPARPISHPNDCVKGEIPAVVTRSAIVICTDQDAIDTYIDYCSLPKQWFAFSRRDLCEFNSL